MMPIITNPDIQPDKCPASYGDQPALVPEKWPALEGHVAVPHRPHYWPSVGCALLALVAPGWAGARLGRASWIAAYVVHFVALLLAAAVLAIAGTSALSISQNQQPPHFDAEAEFRAPLAFIAGMLYMASPHWQIWLGILITLAVIQAIIWLVPLFLLPLLDQGGSRRGLYLRTAKVLLFATIVLIPAGRAAAVILPGIPGVPGIPIFSPHRELEDWPTLVALIVLGWCCLAIVRLLLSDDGGVERALAQPRAIKCEDCGYLLVGLPLTGKCPECGRPIANSLPEARRRTPLAATCGPLTAPIDYLRTVLRVIANARRFGRETCVVRDIRTARTFGWLTCLLLGLTAGVWVFTPISWEWGPNFDNQGLWQLIAACCADIFLVAAFAFGLLLLTSFWEWRTRPRDSAPRAALVYYALAFLYLPVLLARLGWFTICYLRYPLERLGRFQVRIPNDSIWISWAALIGCLILAPALITFILYFVQLRWALRGARFANS